MMKFSTIGTSWITEAFIEAAKQSGLADLISVYSRNAGTAEQFAHKHGVEKWFTTLEGLLDDHSDFIYIASPNSFHYEHVIECIQKQKHVFCEKPMGYTEQQIVHIKEEANKHGVFVFEGYRHLCSPNYEKLKEHLEEIGQIRSTLLQYIQYSSRFDAFKDGQSPNVFSKEFAGGALMDLGVYPVSMAIDLYGEPDTVHYSPVYLSNGVDGSGTLTFKYPDHLVTIMASKIAQGTIPSEIHGEEGTLTLDHISPIDSLKLYSRKTNEVKELASEQDELDMIYELEKFKQMIDQNDKKSHEQWLERSRLVAKWTEIARHQADIYFPGE